MLARVQRIIIAAGLTAAIAWLVYFVLHGRPAVALIGATLIAASHALVLALEFVLLPWINRKDPAPTAGARMLLNAWWREVRTSTRVFGWEQPFRSQSLPDYLPPDAKGRRGVVLVHGFVCNRGVWNPWMRKLRAKGVPFIAVNLEPVFGPIERYPAVIDDAVRTLEQATGLPPVIVGHSMGGLAIRCWLQRCGADARVRHVVTVGSPHRGSWFARFGLAHNTRDMRQGCGWIDAAARCEPASRRALFTCFYSHCDNISAPASTGTLPGADNRHIPGVPHVQLLFEEEVFTEVLSRLAAQAPSEPGHAGQQADQVPVDAGRSWGSAGLGMELDELHRR